MRSWNAAVVKPMPSRTRLLCSASVLTAIALALAACGDGDEDGGIEGEAVTITTEIDFTNQPPKGTFSVDEGSEALGCESGAFVDTEVDDGVNKQLTCEEGGRQGTFTIFFQPEGDLSDRRWRVESATGDFSGLAGEGDFSLEINDEDEDAGVETLTGEITY
jgi:hypothetical protein